MTPAPGYPARMDAANPPDAGAYDTTGDYDEELFRRDPRVTLAARAILADHAHAAPPPALALAGTYGGSVRVYGSSAAAAPHVWVEAEGLDRMTGPHVSVPVHLTLADATVLRDRLTGLIEALGR